MPMFKKKPVVIEAKQLTAENYKQVAAWAEAEVPPVPTWDGKPVRDLISIHIYTLEGVMTAQLDDWIIQGVQGEFYPCKPDIFEQTYEALDGEQ